MKMFLEISLLITAIIILVFLFIYFSQISLAPASNDYKPGSVCLGKDCFQVKLAETGAQRERGLMYVDKLDRDKGMLFIFDKESFYPFWMKNTLIPLDIIWMDASGKVVYISQNIQPCKSLICSSVVPSAAAKYVLEINAGLCQKIGLKVRDELKINLE